MFDELEDIVERLTTVGNEEFFNIFDSKNSFIYFAAFSKFTQFNLNDQKFVDFMIAFDRELHEVEINGVSFDELNKKSTKDKNVVVSKINHLVSLMKDYLDISVYTENKIEHEEDMSVLEFVRKNVDPNFEEEDIELFETAFDDYIVGVDNNSPLLTPKNHYS